MTTLSVQSLIEKLNGDEYVEFEDVMATINEHFNYTPSAFQNGSVENAAGQNEGSCKIFAFAKLNGLDKLPTLACFGRFYRDVLATPEGSDHGNIRNFMLSGWDGIRFEAEALSAK